ncbi:hypothetical protein JCGZ_26994 [Jatropha curcas]|uniref:Uncharacterized protein n=1 Tax=Jatropha curcas TaxID=180498 RepID=A0A067L0I4_JATCU|nr:hypothetical protein JCGZ_26994 [Jatropha curcas]
MTAEVFEVAPEVAGVEISKASGDTLEYNKFYEENVRPALKDVVWSWQGESDRHEREGKITVGSNRFKLAILTGRETGGSSPVPTGSLEPPVPIPNI